MQWIESHPRSRDIGGSGEDGGTKKAHAGNPFSANRKHRPLPPKLRGQPPTVRPPAPSEVASVQGGK